jgi:hypothetical protein
MFRADCRRQRSALPGLRHVGDDETAREADLAAHLSPSGKA